MYPRFIEHRIREALSDTRVVLICGPRQAGKTILANRIADEANIPFLTLDDTTIRDAADADPVGFLRGIDKAVIDEIQRAPDLLLAIKMTVDKDPRAGRFLLTGSADLMTLPRVADSLAGRMEIVRLFPLAQAELQGKRTSFLEKILAGETPGIGKLIMGDDLVETVLAGGYPEALARPRWGRRQSWLLDYVESVIHRDIRDITQAEQLQQTPKLLQALAEHSGRIVNYSDLGAPLGMNHVTTQKYARLFESLFLVHTLQPWRTNKLKRLTKTPKLHFLDAGLLAALKGATPDRVRKDRTIFGPILESFILGEVLKLTSWSDERLTYSHFRDKERNEVDLVIEDRRGRIVGIEVKASATVKKADFSGLRRLAGCCGDRFVLGLVLYDHDRVVPFGERMMAAPISTLWS